ncbi:tripartite tricarboxylate transporter permease [Brevibacillus marinus]|uniref:tripartite tricarboxylate transporter permease n=1 Tax=Brevibacillus marinus TaxID=2496837 RepID=UPI000F84B72B|nr:tripartite tricarboxylate transporter permease [Brevibacillus marinus]
MDLLHNLGLGFSIAFSLENLFFAFVGVLIGTLLGVLPGIGPVSGVALLIPLTYGISPVSAIILMAGVYYGAMYGGSTTSILLNTPGESASVVTTLDGYQMAKQGRAGAALAIAAIGSFVAGTFSTIMLSLTAPALANFALQFGPPEYFSLMLLGLCAVTGLAGKSMSKAFLTLLLGLLISMIGVDLVSGTERFTFGFSNLSDGIHFIIVAVGVFALGEVLSTIVELKQGRAERIKLKGKILPSRGELKRSALPIARGSLLGFLIGVLPGAGATIASFLSYNLEKKLSKRKHEFGKGAIEGVAGPESANNAASGGSLVPMLTLGVPGSGTTAVLLGALMIHGITPGPLLFEKNPDVAWGLIASMYIGNVMLLILNLPLAGLFAKIIDIPQVYLLPLIIVISSIGIYGVTGNDFHLYLLVGFGIAGYFMRKYDYPGAPMILGLVLGPLMEQSLRQSLIMSNGSYAILFTRPISLVLLLLACIWVLWPIVMRKLGKTVLVADDE